MGLGFGSPWGRTRAVREFAKITATTAASGRVYGHVSNFVD
jgi:hypothetical protein